MSDFFEKHRPRISWKISVQMYLGLSIFVLLIGMASFLGWKSLLEMTGIQTTIIQERIPALSFATQIAQKSSTLANISSKLLAVEGESEIAEIEASIDLNVRELVDLIDRVRAIAEEQDEDAARQFDALAEELLQNLGNLESSVVRTLRLRQEINDLFVSSSNESRDINELLIEEIDDLAFFLHTGYADLAQDNPLTLSDSEQKQTLDYYRSLQVLESHGQRVSRLLGEATQLRAPDLLNPLTERFRASIGSGKRALDQVNNESLRQAISRKISIIEAAGLGKGEGAGLFRKLEEVFEEGASQAQILDSNGRIVNALSMQTEGLIKEIQNKSILTLTDFENTLDRNRLQLLAVNFISIFLAFFIGWFFVEKYLIGRIKELSHTMLVMSEGNLETPMNIRGSDEISDMAKSLEIFRDYAVKAQKLNLVEALAKEVQEKNDKLEDIIKQLETAQEQIVMQEKLASLGQLTAGIAHEIKNPLNFINNFSVTSKELLDDLAEALEDAAGAPLSEDSQSYIKELMSDLTGNLDRIHNHGQRTNDIIKGMLQHSRDGSNEATEEINFNRFVDNTVNLAYHGKRTSNSNFNADIKRILDDSIGDVEINPQDISRVIINLTTNACDAIEEKLEKMTEQEREAYSPCIEIETKKVDWHGADHLEIRVRDNGPGIPDDVIQKIFNPFFTTKPTDKGTGLGLSLAHDIVLKNAGDMGVKSTFGEFTEFTIHLPL